MDMIKKIDNKAATFRVSINILNNLDEYSSKTGISKSFIVNAALERYLNNLYDDINRIAFENRNDNYEKDIINKEA